MSIKKSALFLDRDGVINQDKNYVYKIKDFHFIDGIFDLCKEASNRDMALVVVTNQSGIGRGYYTEDDFWILTKWMCDTFLRNHISIDKVYYCPYHPVHGVGRFKLDSFDRKPNPGMLLKARDELNLDLEKSIFIGDKVTDIQAARAANLDKAVLFSCDKNLSENNCIKPDFISNSLTTITRYLFSEE